MKRKSSCQSCRESHRRCITRPKAKTCNSCDELGRECNFGPRFQFRQWKGQRPEKICETPSVSIIEDRANHVDSGRKNISDESSGAQSVSDIILAATADNSNETYASSLDGASSGISPGGAASLPVADTPMSTVVNDGVNSESPTSQRQTTGGQNGHAPESSQSAASPNRPSTAHCPPDTPLRTSRLTQREAYLFKIWTEKLALVSDAVDDARHFGVIASRLALDHPVLLNGILAVASRFDSLAAGGSSSDSDIESSYYHGRCIELLIDLLLKPPGTYDSTLLAAVVVSRLYEENDIESDAVTYHLGGTRTLLSNDVITRITAEGGLAEAACWLHLRQATYVAIVHRQPPNTPLEVYRGLTAFRKSDDTSYANRMVYLFARILVAFFSDSANRVHAGSPGGADIDNWDFFQQELEAWFDAKPSSFEPLYCESPDVEVGKPFPCMWMLSTVPSEFNPPRDSRSRWCGWPAVALQHYYSCMIMLCLHRCNGPPGSNGFEAARRRRTNEKSIASYLCALMGLALSNPQAPNAWYQPCHMLDLCGYCIRSPIERAHTIQYLEEAKRQVQWKTAPVIAALKRQWDELDGYEV